MKRKFLLLLAICAMLVALVFALSACDSDTDDGQTTTTTAAMPTVTRMYLVDGNSVGSLTVSVDDVSTPHIAVPEKEHYGGKWELSFVDAGIMYYNAVYTPLRYTVTFVANGVTVDTQVFTVEDKDITVPDIPNKQHYESAAWQSYELDGGNKTVNAVYGAPIEYTVTFIADGETVDMETYTLENKNIVVPEAPDRLYGYCGEGETYWLDYSLDGGDKFVYAKTTCQTQAKYTLDGSYYYVSGYNEIIDGKIEILSKYNGLPVAGISEAAFSDCKELTDVSIPSSINSIGKNAFSGCDNLENAKFVALDKWKAGTTQISANDLANFETAATYLKTTYSNLSWNYGDNPYSGIIK